MQGSACLGRSTEISSIASCCRVCPDLLLLLAPSSHPLLTLQALWHREPQARCPSSSRCGCGELLTSLSDPFVGPTSTRSAG